MKKALLLLVTIMLWSCSDRNEDIVIDGELHMSVDELPRIDCSTSTQPLGMILAAKLMNLPYAWWLNVGLDQTWYCYIDYESSNLPQEEKDDIEGKLYKKLQRNGTHSSLINLIDGNTDVAIASRGLSREEKAYAKKKGVEVMEQPIGRDAFIFMVNNANPIKNLSTAQIQNIYTGKTRNWKDVGGNDATISPYIRNSDSGSQEKMETMVMQGLTMIDWPEMITTSMTAPFEALRSDANGIAYTPYFYYSIMAREQTWAKYISVDGVEPTKTTIANETYPYVSEICVAVRANVDRKSNAYKIYKYLTTSHGQSIVEESGYVPLAK